ncbi:hypothetical protein D0O09_05840 [Pseudomonas putida]|nr:hypothetical protein D0O09_05840 [Pseudomonas putida]
MGAGLPAKRPTLPCHIAAACRLRPPAWLYFPAFPNKCTGSRRAWIRPTSRTPSKLPGTTPGSPRTISPHKVQASPTPS